MSFNTFCNICFTKEHIIKLCVEENESIFNILISFTSSTDTVNGIIYLCINCCNKLEEYDKFRELFLTNFVRFRYLYNEHKKQLEICNALDIETKLKAFVEINVERASGTPLIENYEVAQDLKNNISSNVDIIRKELHGEYFKEDSDELYHEKGSIISYTSLLPEYINLENSIKTCHVKYENDSYDEGPENSNESSTVEKENAIETCYVKYENEYFDEDPENSNESSAVEKGAINKTKKTTRKSGVCNVCQKRLSRASDLKKHMRTHTHERPFSCDVCQKRFLQKAHLTYHKLTHTREKPYKCDDCALGFPLESLLKRHRRIHTTRDRPFSCDECPKTFLYSTNLKEHKMIHSGEKPYKCDVCDWAFSQSYALKRHKRIHTGEKPYSCDECQKAFADMSSLKLHKLRHTGVKPYECDECPKTFLKRCSLVKHKAIHSGEKPKKYDE